METMLTINSVMSSNGNDADYQVCHVERNPEDVVETSVDNQQIIKISPFASLSRDDNLRLFSQPTKATSPENAMKP